MFYSTRYFIRFIIFFIIILCIMHYLPDILASVRHIIAFFKAQIYDIVRSLRMLLS